MVSIDGTRVRSLREKLGLTQLYVASSVGVTTDTISRWENRKYPSIKKENALKLAETLEVDLEDILEKKESASHETGTSASSTPASSRNTRGSTGSGPSGAHGEAPWMPLFWGARRKLLFFLVAVAALAASALLLLNRQADTHRLSAQRILPSHAPPGSGFPVMIHVTPADSGRISLIITDVLPKGIHITGSAPRWSASTPDRKQIKWIVSGTGEPIIICYMAQIEEDVPAGMLMQFSGSITVNSGKNRTIVPEGNSSISAEPYHWADINSDGQIDDEEILRVFGEFGDIDTVAPYLEEIKRLWSAGGYEWDRARKKYIPVERGNTPLSVKQEEESHESQPHSSP